MRIIAGEHRGRRLKSIPGMATRPTPDRLRESLFSIIQSEVQRCRFADLYAGTGAVGLEALSRGASSVLFVEMAGKAAEVLTENVQLVSGSSNAVKILRQPVKKALRNLAADIVFLDPPYEQTREYEEAMKVLGQMDTLQLVLVQHPPRLQLQHRYGRLENVRVLRQGDNVVTFYRPSAGNSETEGDDE
jgi:16S rRNA (guanine966-N2)-methyltransferase